MKAPDKIYIDSDLINFHCLGEHINDDEIEYIRKDALLEWAKEKLEEYKPMAKIDDARWGQCNAFKQLIDKIESL